MTAGPFRRDCTLYQRQMAGGGFFPDNDSQGASSPAKVGHYTNNSINLQILGQELLQRSRSPLAYYQATM